MSNDLIWTITAFILTLLVLSYALGDHPIFKVVTYLFVGVSSGFLAILIIYQILFPRLVVPLMTGTFGEKISLIVPAVLSLLLIFKLSPRFSGLGSPSMGFLVGVGAAATISGAITGTLFGQINGALSPFDVSAGASFSAGQLFSGVVLLIGTISSLAYFQFTNLRKNGQEVSRPGAVKFLANIGKVFIAITLGSLFAGAISAALAALIERVDFILTVIQSFFS